MSDPDKPTPESPSDGDAEAPASGQDQAAPAANVISIEQARLELLGRKRKATPPRGMEGPIRMRRREVPAPVTLPPGEHSSVIVTDTPAARAHIDKKTVHPGEPGQTFDRKVRVKTQYDPRRVPTQLSDRRGFGRLGAEAETPSEVSGEEEVGSLWNRASQPPDPGVITSRTPRSSLARPRPIPRNDRSAPLFVVGVMIVAALGAVVVFLLSRGKGNEGSGQPDVAVTAPPSVAAPPATSATASAPAATAPATASATSTGEAPAASVSATATASGVPAAATSAAPAGPVVTRPSSSGAATKPAASAAPTTAPQTTATSILPFGKEEP